jgi:hypothetical protein
MPNVRQYDAPANLGLTPSETGVESVAAAARRTEGFYSQAADALNQTGARIGSTIRDVGQAAVDYEDHREISAGAAHGAQLFDSLTRSKDQAVQSIDPNDPAYGQKVEIAVKQWREQQLEPALQQFSSGFNTEKSQEWAEHFVDTTRQHMFTSTSADISTAAGIGIHNAVRTLANTASNTAVLDPSSVSAQLDLVEHSINGMVDSSSLKGTQGAAVKSEVLEKTREQIVKAGAVGAIQKSSNPEQTAQEWVAKYPQYINGAEAIQLANNARQQIRANNYDVEQQRRRDQEITKDKSNEAANQYIIDIRSQDPRLANDPTAKKVLNDPTLTKTDKNNLLNYIDRQNKPETDARTSQGTFIGLLRDLRAPGADPDKVMQKAWDARLADPGAVGSLSERDFQQFRQEVVARKTPEGEALERDRANFFKQYAGTIVGQNGYDPVQGSPKLYAAEMDARRTENVLRAKGLDPHLAYDPASEYFLGRNERLQKYQGTMQSDLSTQATTPTPAAAAPPKSSHPDVPFELRGIASLSHNKDWSLFRDDTTGKIYNAQGKEVQK